MLDKAGREPAFLLEQGKLAVTMWRVLNRAKRLIKLFFGFRAVSKATDADQQQRARHALMQQFADARGVTMKVGQLLAANADDDVFTPLVTSIKPIPVKKLLPDISAALNLDWKQVFKSIDESQAAASLGQVHHAVLLSGEEVGLKIQYPDIQAAIESEMSLLGLMPKAGPVKQWSFDLDGYRRALKNNMEKELDYRHEADVQQRFYQQLKLPSVVVPKVYTEYCNEKILVQDWQEGVFLDQTINWPLKSRISIARTLLGLLLTSLFNTRLLHGDPHMGNSVYRFREGSDDIEMVLMDYGCTIELQEQQSLALLKLILSVREKTSGLPLENFAAMGFDVAKLEKIEAYLPRLCLYLFQPFLGDGVFQLNRWHPGQQITELLGEQRWWFRSAGPAQLIFIMRAFQGLVQQLQILQADIDWWQVLLDVLPAERLQQARDYQCPRSRVTAALDFIPLASSLRVKVSRQGEIRADITLPAEAVLELESLIPAEIQTKLTESGETDLSALIEKVKASSLAAQTIFDYDDKDKHYHVWLE